MTMPVYFLSDELLFPSPRLASADGLLAVGGDLTPERLLLAYRLGIFPWYSDGDPILWWSPDPRLVMFPKELKVSKSLKKIIKQNRFHVTVDNAFEQVIRSCAHVRLMKHEGTWITDDMIEAYAKLYEAGFAHSVETWYEEKLVGGLYGLSLGKCFFGESMFSCISNASKVAFVKLAEYLQKLSFDMIDCQVATDHLLRFGAREIPRDRFLNQLEISLKTPARKGRWHFSL